MTSPDSIQQFLSERSAAGDFPGFAWRVASGERVLAEGIGGRAMVAPREIPVADDTIWDLASLTKCLVTAPLAALLEKAGVVSLSASLEAILPDLPADKRALTLEMLLTHTAGFPAWAPSYLFIDSRRELESWLRAVPLECAPGTRVVYSDLGYLLAGLCVEKLAGMSLEDFFAQQFARPLHLRDTGFNPPFTARRRVAASELGNAHERTLAEANPAFAPRAANHSWPSELLWGTVHDGNARHLGGVAGHAGLFGTLPEVHRLARHLVSGPLREHFTTPRADDGATARSLALVLGRTRGCAADGALAGNSAGHTGFTGVSWHYEPDRDRHFFLMTNRTHPAIPPADTTAWRREFLRRAAMLPELA